jgi:hypothetical protein
MRGEVIYLYAFDVANEIATSRVREVLSCQSFPYEIKTDHTYPKDVPLYKPLTFQPPDVSDTMLGRSVQLVIRIFEVGVVNVAMHVPFEVDSLVALQPFHQNKLDSGQTRDELARRLCQEVCESIQEAMIRGSSASDPEAYTVFCLTELGGEGDAHAWFSQHRREIAGLLSEAPADSLSDLQVDESVRIHRSFGKADLAVIDWDASLVVELDGFADDVLYILELANLQLEEFRVMDRRLDLHLDRAYHDLEGPRSFFGIPTSVHNWLRRFRVDATKLTDEVTHITKFLGDWHLARIYLGAAERFHLQEWQKSIADRLAQLDQVYQVLQAEVYERRMLWLEIAILVCFLIDLAALFFWKR